jgi:hypothetical protein
MTQDEIVVALAHPSFYPHRVDAVEHVQTHISHVFLAGAYAYKLKKALRFPFLDFSTLAHRRHFCEEEVRLNRRLCPGVYLAALPLTRETDGRLSLAGSGVPVDYVVRMRRLPADGMLDVRIDAGRLPEEAMERIAATVAVFHAAAPAGARVAAFADPVAIERRWNENVTTIGAFVGSLFRTEDHELLADFGPFFIGAHEELLRARQRDGRIRDGHGDLHAANICIVEARAPADADGAAVLAPGLYIFDCIEFSEALRCNDVASEVAFLVMDLESRGRSDLAGRLVGAYARAAADPQLDALLPFYCAYRACVRAKVEGLRSAEPEVEPADRAAAAARARVHLALAGRYAWRAGGPAVIACAGLSGAGKTALASLLADATGFRLVSSDEIRARGGGPAAEPAAGAAYGTGRYAPAARQAVYGALVDEVASVLAGGGGVIADATFLRRENRRRLAAAAGRSPVVFVECRAHPDVVRRRMTEREDAPGLSDARWGTYEAQRREQEPFGADEPHVVLDTGGALAAARTAALRALWRWRRGAAINRGGAAHPTGSGGGDAAGERRE